MSVMTMPQASIMAPTQIEGRKTLSTILLGISSRAYGKKKTVRLHRSEASYARVGGETRDVGMHCHSRDVVLSTGQVEVLIHPGDLCIANWLNAMSETEARHVSSNRYL